MGTYLSKRGPVEGCPQPDGREMKVGDLVYVAQRPSRSVGAGTPFALNPPEVIEAERQRIARLVPGWTP